MNWEMVIWEKNDQVLSGGFESEFKGLIESNSTVRYLLYIVMLLLFIIIR